MTRVRFFLCVFYLIIGSVVDSKEKSYVPLTQSLPVVTARKSMAHITTRKIQNSFVTTRIPLVALLQPNPRALFSCHESLTTTDVVSIVRILSFQKCYVSEIIHM